MNQHQSLQRETLDQKPPLQVVIRHILGQLRQHMPFSQEFSFLNLSFYPHKVVYLILVLASTILTVKLTVYAR